MESYFVRLGSHSALWFVHRMETHRPHWSILSFETFSITTNWAPWSCLPYNCLLEKAWSIATNCSCLFWLHSHSPTQIGMIFMGMSWSSFLQIWHLWSLEGNVEYINVFAEDFNEGIVITQCSHTCTLIFTKNTPIFIVTDNKKYLKPHHFKGLYTHLNM